MKKIARISVRKSAGSHLSVEVDVPLFLSKEKRKYVAYSPALDLCTYGKDRREAQKHFAEVLQIFFDEVIEAGTLDDVLLDLGWTRTRKSWQPPVEVIQTVRVPLLTALAPC